MRKSKWLCFGAGAIGTYIGGSLALAGYHVTFVERAEAAEELRKRGMRLDLSLDRRRSITVPLEVPAAAIRVHGSLAEALDGGPFEAALYALKCFDTPEAAQAMESVAAHMPPVVCFSNGVENEAMLARTLGESKVIAATLTTAVGRHGVGNVVLERLRGMGIESGRSTSSGVIAAANAALLRARPFANAAAMKWSKMLTNLIANPTSAILDMTPSEVLHHPGLYRLEIGMLRECLAVMKKLSIPVVDLPGTPVRALALAVRLPVWASRPFLARAAGAGRGRKMPSFHIDLHSGRGKSEVEYLHGAVARAGAEAGVSTPINAFLTRTLIALTRGEMPREEFARQPDRLLKAFRDLGESAPA